MKNDGQILKCLNYGKNKTTSNFKWRKYIYIYIQELLTGLSHRTKTACKAARRRGGQSGIDS